MPDKNMLPDEVEGFLEEWRAWKEDMIKLFQKENAEAKGFLEEVEKEPGTVDEQWRNERRTKYGKRVVDGGGSVWEVLKNRTKRQTEARRLVASAAEDGCVAWQ